MSKLDKTLRIIIGIIILVVFGAIYPTWWALIGLIPLITGLVGFCPIYKILGISTGCCCCSCDKDKH
ncbi:YgaP family membrane protein [Campylobacter geochelonis]|uniref:Protein of uncharacterized function (DUF2892) n=1 Tax=Campylobacter geochelonis TaxID=1780362 RepID=A0A128EDC5_9BACT|nr:DUF2892 domain-containing protein [Campylobacter geochelonis]QKF72219.1 DUF2892 domain-containing membrane protein [Campylobacter geochelonis]CZE46136.1 Protein of uncharacterised function (DUF2892) [Campylobacter geochelonis]CZE46491.1 Protein of uncharacterised function (DUF2892) [Campylobacter geochelonis]CZE50781.1 Protein of uncharacterised function (DUF2892) [Campylobacter geochelonis]